MTINLDTTVALFDGRPSTKEELSDPIWIGTLNEFWQENQDGYTFGEIKALGEELSFGAMVRLGGGAAAESTLMLERVRLLRLRFDMEVV